VRSVQLDLTVPSRPASDCYATLADLARYPEHSPAVRSVEITDVGDGSTVSRWEVTFRAGLLRWVEQDSYDPARRRIDFRQLEGDVAVFEGSWTCTDAHDGTRVSFEARLDMGIPSLADALEPIAVRTLVDNTVAIVSGLLGDGIRVDAVQHGTGELGGPSDGEAEEAAGRRQSAAVG
jgi:ribosome-associated toxin RatA of RatAB toxin-antitoxin module